MSTQPFEQAVACTRSVLESVQADQLTNETPCASWDVAGLINHVVGAQYFFTAGMTGQAPPAETDYASGDYLAAFDEASGKAIAAFQEDGALESMKKLPFGEMPGAAVMGLAMNDTFTHGWDLAKATGQSTDLAPELAAGILQQAQASIQEGFRGPEGAPFGAEQQAPEGASAADQLAAFLGRQV
jgi:uncharacterized protein (TIGR03086 family)